MRTQFFLLIVFVTLGLGGCALQKNLASTSNTYAPAPGNEFAVLVGEAPQGIEKTLPSTPYGGPAAVIVGSSYTSGLNQECRLATVTEPNRQLSIAVCKTDTGWISLPSIFEAAPY